MVATRGLYTVHCQHPWSVYRPLSTPVVCIPSIVNTRGLYTVHCPHPWSAYRPLSTPVVCIPSIVNTRGLYTVHCQHPRLLHYDWAIMKKLIMNYLLISRPISISGRVTLKTGKFVFLRLALGTNNWLGVSIMG